MIDRLREVDPERVATRWRDAASSLRDRSDTDRCGVPDGVPVEEVRRTPAAERIGTLAARAGLFPFHFERRAHLPLPLDHVPPGRDDLAAPPSWDGGHLPERKYQSFRHDLLIASHHPGHRAKWGVHELCHGLVGFAWHPEATPFFHATAGRVAELLPVALWYGFDEAFLQRCPSHRGQGALFELHCPACEALAGPDPDASDAVERIAFGLRYVIGELEAVEKSRKDGRVRPWRVATLDLSSDGIAYALAHGRRLDSPSFHRFARAMLRPGEDVSADLDGLTTRVIDTTLALLGEGDPPELAPSPEHGRARWILQDLAWRVLTVSDLAGSDITSLDDAFNALAEAVPATADPQGDPAAALHDAIQTVSSHLARCDAAGAESVFATGYDLPGVPRAVEPLAEGLAASLPAVWDGIEQDREPLIDAFAATEDVQRLPLAVRFADWLTLHHPGPLANLARWEAALRHLPPRTRSLPGPPRDDNVRRADGWQVLRSGFDMMALSEAVETGAIGFVGTRMVVHHGSAPERVDAILLAGRDEDGEIALLDLEADAAAAFEALPASGGTFSASDETRDALLSWGALWPAALVETEHHVEAERSRALWWPA